MGGKKFIPESWVCDSWIICGLQVLPKRFFQGGGEVVRLNRIFLHNLDDVPIPYMILLLKNNSILAVIMTSTCLCEKLVINIYIKNTVLAS